MCLRAQVPRQPPPGKMGRRGGDGRSRLGAMATDPELRPEGSVAHASTGGASPPEDRAHQRPRGARPGRVVSAGVRPGARTAKGTRARLSDSVHRRTLSRRLRLTDSAPFRSREAGPRPGLRRHCGPARHGRRRHTDLIHAGLPGGSRSARHRILRLCFARRASVRRRPVEVAASDEQQPCRALGSARRGSCFGR
jgi:hypothetical protein